MLGRVSGLGARVCSAEVRMRNDGPSWRLEVRRRRVTLNEEMLLDFEGAEGAAREVLRPCLTGVAGPLIGNGLFLEHEDVLTKEALVATALIDLERRAALLDAVLGLCQWINISCLRRLSNAARGARGSERVRVTQRRRRFPIGPTSSRSGRRHSAPARGAGRVLSQNFPVFRSTAN